MQQVLAIFGLRENDYETKQFGSGLINYTWLAQGKSSAYILQKINKNVFKQPGLIDKNIAAIAEYLKRTHPDYLFSAPLPFSSGKTIVEYENEYYRLYNFIPSKTFSVVTDAEVAYEAAKQFGAFTKNLSGFKVEILQETIPHFHDLDLRYNQFLQAVNNGNKQRITHSKKTIQSLQQHSNIVDTYNDLIINPAFKKRVTHHDTKISNVLFNDDNKGICVIDTDTVMPGFLISDVGDMLRTYLSPVSEEETNFNLIKVRDEYFEGIAKGYLSEMKSELSTEEMNAFVYAGKFMIYMQALRFITDYLNDDVYYGSKYELHNFNRAQNQLRLLERLIEKEDFYNSIVNVIAQSKKETLE